LPGYYHPTRSAAIYLGRNRLGYFGQIHPIILQKYKIDKAVIAFEIILNALPATSKSKGSSKGDYAVSNYQSVTRDYAFIVDVSVPAGEVINMIRALDRSIIKKVELFDIYQGQIKNSSEEGFEQKSLAISVTLQDQYKTLTELELTAIHDKIVKSMADKYQAKLRG
jgi:phenylalanyl-tRNA synthetase beta chain